MHVIMQQYLDAYESNICRRLIEDVPHQRQLRIHRCVAVQVPARWGWEKDRLIDDYHLLYVRSGEGGYRSQGLDLPFQSNSVIFAGSGCRHAAWQNPSHSPDIISVRFGLYDVAQQSLRRRHSGNVVLKNAARMFAWQPTQAAVVDSLFERLHRSFQGRELGTAAANLHVLLSMMSEQASNCEQSQGGDQRIEVVRQQLELHPVRRLTVDDMAVLAGLSRNYFVRLFKQSYGMSPKTYQIEARLRYARMLLEQSDATVAQVAEDVLYPDAFSFSKQYRRYYGCAPSTHRQ